MSLHLTDVGVERVTDLGTGKFVYYVTLSDPSCNIDRRLEKHLSSLANTYAGVATGTGTGFGLGLRDYSFSFSLKTNAQQFVKAALKRNKYFSSTVECEAREQEDTTMTTTVEIVELKKNVPMVGVHKARAKAAKKIAGRALTGVLHINRACTIVRLYTSDGQVTTSWHEQPVDVDALCSLFKQGLNIELADTVRKEK